MVQVTGSVGGGWRCTHVIFAAETKTCSWGSTYVTGSSVSRLAFVDTEASDPPVQQYLIIFSQKTKCEGVGVARVCMHPRSQQCRTHHRPFLAATPSGEPPGDEQRGSGGIPYRNGGAKVPRQAGARARRASYVVVVRTGRLSAAACLGATRPPPPSC